VVLDDLFGIHIFARMLVFADGGSSSIRDENPVKLRFFAQNATNFTYFSVGWVSNPVWG